MVTGIIKGQIQGIQYQKEFLPVAQPGENLFILPFRIPVKVLYVEQIGFLVNDFGRLEPNEVKRDIELDFLDAGRKGLLQLRFFMLDDFVIENFRQPRAISRFFLDRAKTIFRKTLIEYNLDSFLPLTEFFVFRDFYPTVDIRNPNNFALENSRIVFFGYKYTFMELKEIPKEYTIISAGGYKEEI